MKKILSLLVALTVVLSSVSIFATATEDDGLMLDLDLTTYDGTKESIQNKVSGVTNGIWVPDVMPGVGSYVNSDGESFTYASFDGTSARQFIAYGNGEGAANLRSKPSTTVEMWMMPQVESGKYPKIFSIAEGVTASWAAEFGPDNSGFINNGSLRTNDINTFLTKWSHIVFTRELDTVNSQIIYKTYINGRCMGTGYKTGVTEINDGSSGILFGGNYWRLSGADFYKGGIAQIKMYSTILPESTILSHFKEKRADFLGNTLLDVDMANFPETANTSGVYTNFKDKSDNFKKANLGTVLPTKGTETGIDGSTINYLGFDGTTREQRIAFGNSEGVGAILNQEELSVEMWMQPKCETGKYPKFFMIASSGESSAKSWWAETGSDNNGYIAIFDHGSNAIRVNNFSVYSDKWTHIIMTRKFDAELQSITYKLYANGKLIGTKELTGKTALDDTNRNVCFGGNFWCTGGDVYSGKISLLKVYANEFDDTLAMARYNETKSPYCVPYSDNVILDVDFSKFPQAVNQYGIAGSFPDKTGNITASNIGNDFPQKKTFTGNDGSTVYYADFDGTSTEQRIAMGGNEGFAKLANKPQTTIEAWMKADFRDNNYAKIFMIGNNSNNSNKMWAAEMGGSDNGYIKVSQRESQMIRKTGLAGKNEQWVHLVLTRDFNETAKTITYKAYLDGELLGENTATGQESLADSGNICFGGNYWNNGTERYKGGIATLKMYDTIIDANTVASNYTAGKGIFKSFDDEHKIFDLGISEGAEGAASFKDKAGTITKFWTEGIPQFSTFTSKSGTTSNYVKFDGTTKKQHVSIGTGENFALLKNKAKTSISMWVYTADPSKSQDFFMIASSGSTAASWRGAIRDHQLYQYKENNAPTSGAIDISNFKNKWFNYVITREFDEETSQITYKTYFNGELFDTKTFSDITAINDCNNLCFGGSTWNDVMPFEGGIAQIKMYDEILTNDYVSQNYNDMKASYEADEASISATVSFIDDLEETVPQISGSSDAYAKITLAKSSELGVYKADIIVAYYDMDNKLISASAPVLKTINDGTTTTAEIIPLNITSSVYGVKVFVWSDEDGITMIPLCNISGATLPYIVAKEGL